MKDPLTYKATSRSEDNSSAIAIVSSVIILEVNASTKKLEEFKYHKRKNEGANDLIDRC